MQEGGISHTESRAPVSVTPPPPPPHPDFQARPHTLPCLKWITNRALLHGTWNSAQCYVEALDGRGVWGRMNTCICMAESLRCSSETITTLLISYSPRLNKKKFKTLKSFIGEKKKERSGNSSPIGQPCVEDTACQGEQLLLQPEPLLL